DTERAVEILTRYQSTLRAPEEQELKASIGKVSHIFQSELFQALLDIHQFYELTLRSAPAPEPEPGRQQPGSPAEPPEVSPARLPRAAAQGAAPRLVRVTARRTEAPASVCNLLLGARAALPQVRL
ncbi:DLG1 protein, partial [Nothoprocta ornata]|nr:DLG1 protein [Nothoprocta pentlandii]NWX97444.1 DLG1 protein [Nothoprocta ornata]